MIEKRFNNKSFVLFGVAIGPLSAELLFVGPGQQASVPLGHLRCLRHHMRRVVVGDEFEGEYSS